MPSHDSELSIVYTQLLRVAADLELVN